MPSVAKCEPGVSANTLVTLAHGPRVPIRSLSGTKPDILSLNKAGILERTSSCGVWSRGVTEVFEVRLASGRVALASGGQRFFGPAQSVEVRHLRAGFRLALSRAWPEPEASRRWPDSELILLGHLVGDGSYLKGQPLRYVTASEANSEAVRKAAEEMGSRVKRYAGRGLWHQLLISGNGDRWRADGVGKWLKGLGIFNQRSHEKRLPQDVFGLPSDQVALLLRHLWATDGCITPRSPGKRGSHGVFFTSSSPGLVADVSALLMRFGIVARIRREVREPYRPWYLAYVSGGKDQRAFLDLIGTFGPRVEPGARLRSLLETRAVNTNVDTLPKEAFCAVRDSLSARGITIREIAARRGKAMGGIPVHGFCPSRALLDDYAEKTGDVSLLRWSRSDLFWDRVLTVEPAGREEVFGLSVDDGGYWLADALAVRGSEPQCVLAEPDVAYNGLGLLAQRAHFANYPGASCY